MILHELIITGTHRYDGGRTAEDGDDEKMRRISSERSIWASGTEVVQSLKQFSPKCQIITASTGLGGRSTRQEKTPIGVVMRATGVPAIPRRKPIRRLREGGSETGNQIPCLRGIH